MRFRLAFSVRSLLVLVAVLCAWLAWERSVVVERTAALKAWKADPNVRVRTASEQLAILRSLSPARVPRNFAAMQSMTVSKIDSVPWIRRMLGDEAIQEVRLPPDDPRAELASRVFPEARIIVSRWGASRDRGTEAKE
jgi:hypothetical protein